MLKRETLARIAALFGLTRLLERFPRSSLLLVLTYHRIGDAGKTPFDPGVFSCGAQDLHHHIVELKKKFATVTLDKAKPY